MFFKLGSTVESVMSTFTTDGVGPAASAASTCIRAGPASRGRTKIEARRYFFMMPSRFQTVAAREKGLGSRWKIERRHIGGANIDLNQTTMKDSPLLVRVVGPTPIPV